MTHYILNHSLIMHHTHVWLGVATALALEQLVRTRIRPEIIDFKFPIISGVAAILKGKITPKIGLKFLMQYPIRDENRGS